MVCFSMVSLTCLPAVSTAFWSTLGVIETLTTLPSICLSIASVTPSSDGMSCNVAYPIVVTYVSPPQQDS
ncbi:Uncharacterised protein [Mycobacteroides abscessus subsp. abscessus]|nr:Uncharacterised protein [Mycobacteroides abscessus subsp. abscessus]